MTDAALAAPAAIGLRAQRVAVIDPGSGNLASVLRAIDRAAEGGARPVLPGIARDAMAVAAADRIVLPGQGAFAACMRGLLALPDVAATLEARVRGQGVPLLGICVGMQILAARGLEHGVTAGLGWITGEIAPMAPRGADGAPLPLPQMGWNTLDFAPLTARTDTAPLTARTDTAPLTAETVTAPLTAETDTAPLTAATHALLRGVAPGAHAYFVHSYALSGGDPAEIVATTDYGGAVPALVARGPIAGTQFHVEKSGETGLTILANFLRWTP